jgi:hypothetical protein
MWYSLLWRAALSIRWKWIGIERKGGGGFMLKYGAA